MSRQANILSFDEAKRDVSAPRRPIAPPSLPLRYADDYPTFESPFRQTSSSARASARPIATQGARTRSVATAAVARPSSVPRAVSSPYASARRTGGFASEAPARHIQIPRGRAVNASDDALSFSSRTAVGERAVARRPVDDFREDAEAEGPREEKRPSRFAAFKKSRAKSKAERAFTKQFGDAGQGSDTASSGPRAAVYKGEMGAKHRQAARMQNDSNPSASGKHGFSIRSLASLKSSPKFIVTAAVTACLALSCVFLYPAAQQYYQAIREHDRLEAEYAALEDRNAALESNVASLQTNSGVEARAHEQFGWVKNGEETASVRGLDLEQEDANTFRANITSDSIKAPETWYSPLLDTLFGVE